MTHHSRATPCPQVCHRHGPSPALPPTQEVSFKAPRLQWEHCHHFQSCVGTGNSTKGQDMSHWPGRALSPRQG